MEVPCLFCFVGNGGKLKKLKSFFKTLPISSGNGNTAVSTSTTVLYDQPLLTIAKEGSPDQHNAKLNKQPLLDMKTQCTTGKALLQTLSPKAGDLEILDTTLNDQSILASSTMWVTFERNILYASDKLLIENGKEFTDKHIHMLNQ